VAIADQLAALPVTNSLKVAATPAAFTKIPWAESEGTWSATEGWRPVAFVLGDTDDRSGFYYNPGFLAGDIAVGIKKTTGSLSISERTYDLWLHADFSNTEPHGYQLVVQTVISGTVKFILRKWKKAKGAEDPSVSVIYESAPGLWVSEGDWVYLVSAGNKLQIYRRIGEGTPQLFAEVLDSTYRQGLAGLGGNGSSPVLTNFTVGEIQAVPLSQVAVKSEPQSGRLAYYLRRPDGTTKRLGGDEGLAENIGRNFIFGTAVPGGHTNMSLSLTRDPRVDYGDYELFDEFIAKGPGNESAFEGYNIEMPNSTSDEVGLVATGWASSLKENPTYQEIIVDRDMTRWGDQTAASKINLIAANITPGTMSIAVDPVTGKPAIQLEFSDAWLSPWKPYARAFYDAGPTAKIKIISFTFKGLGNVASNLSFVLEAVTGSDPSWVSGFNLSGDFYTVAEGEVGFVTPAPNRYGLLQFVYPSTPAGIAGEPYVAQIKGIVVIGDHTIPVLGGWVVLASDVVANIIGRAAPMQRYSLGPEGSIQPSSFGIPHMIYPDPVSAEDAVLQASKYDVPDWGVYDNREFFWRPPGSGRLWVAREDDSGTTLQDAGKQAEDTYNGVIVEFTDPSGKRYTVGPPSTAGVDYTDASLRDYSELNPLNEHGRSRLGKLVVSAITTLSGAIQLGGRWLQEELAISDRGTAVVTGFVQDSLGNYEPVWKIRAGDRIRFDDVDGRERRIIETSYNHEERTNSLTLDSTPHRLEALMEKMQVELVAVGSGA
jgi:hypothetical protein